MQTAKHHPEVINAGRLAALEKKAGAPVRHAREPDAMAKQGAPPAAPLFVSLDRETRAAVDTATAAFHLNRKPQTLRCWAVYESGPIRAFRMHGRLMWPTARLRDLCRVAP